MNASDVRRAIAAATGAATSLDLPADDAVILHDSNKLTLRVTPCDVVVRVTHEQQQIAHLEIERAQALAAAGCPVGVVEPRVDPLVYPRDGFALTFWVYYEQGSAVTPADYASALQRLHRGMRTVGIASPQFRDRIADARQVFDDPALSPELAATDRSFLASRLASVSDAIEARGADEQLLHGEPHPGNILTSRDGALFVDFETLCRGPVEFDLAHVPEAVCAGYPDLDPELLDDCRQLVLALVAAWRWRVGDEFPHRRRWGEEFLRVLRAGPPWPTLDEMSRRFTAG